MPKRWVAALVLALIAAGVLALIGDPMTQERALGASPPGWRHWMGTDDYGRDLLARFAAGGIWSLATGAAATVIALGLGWVVGSVAGWYGRWTDRAVMAAGDLFLSVPWLYMLIGLRAALPVDMRPRTATAIMLTAIAAVSWARTARLVRGAVLSLSEREYVLAARGFQVPGWRIFLSHIAPATLGIVFAQGLALLPRFVLAEVTLTFLGLGAGDAEPSWGALLIGLKQAYLLPVEWWRVLPVLAMLPVFMGFAWAAQVAARRFRSAR